MKAVGLDILTSARKTGKMKESADSAMGGIEAPQVAAAIDYKGWWTVVWLRRAPFIWPPSCACCLVATQEQGDLKLKGRTFVYPLCPSCARHGRVDDVALPVSLGVSLMVTPLLYYCLFGFKIAQNFTVTGLFFLITFVGILYLTYGPFFLLLGGRKTSRCADSGWPVQEADGPATLPGKERADERLMRTSWEAIKESVGPQSFVLRFWSGAYARQFVQANGGDPASRIVRIDAEA